MSFEGDAHDYNDKAKACTHYISDNRPISSRISLGNKKNNITIVYTPWDNLKKTAGMETGQVSFHKQNKVNLFKLIKIWE